MVLLITQQQNQTENFSNALRIIYGGDWLCTEQCEALPNKIRF